MKHILDYIKKYKFLLLIILPAFFLYMLVIFPSGSYFCFKGECGYYFWGVHGHDAIWHLAIAETSFNKVPFIAPTFAGESLYGYNWLLDFVIFLLSRLGIPTIISYFKLIPVVWFIVFTFLIIKLGRKLNDKPLFVSILLFISYFSTSFSYFITLYKSRTIVGSSGLINEMPMHLMSNLPFSASIIFILLILTVMKDKRINLHRMFILSLCIFILMGLKFYGGIIGLFLVGTHLLVTLYPKEISRLVFYSLFFALVAGAGVLLFYNPLLSARTGFPFAFVPFALVHTITEDQRFFYNRYLTDARYYLLNFRIGPRLILIELTNLLLFLSFFLGIRIFGFVYLLIQVLRRKIDRFDLVLTSTIVFSITLTVLLVQKGEWWNTIQFFIYGIFLLTIHTSKLIYRLMRSGRVYLFSAIIIMLLSLPTTVDMVRLFSLNSAATYLPEEEMRALEYLRKQPNGVVLSPLYSSKLKNDSDFLPLYRYDDTAYVSAFSGKPVYLADKVQLEITGLAYKERLKKVERGDCSILDEVDYIYEVRDLSREDKLVSRCPLHTFKKVYKNKSINIYSKRERTSL